MVWGGGSAWFRALRDAAAGLPGRFGGLWALVRFLRWILVIGLLLRLVLIPVSLDPDLVGFAQTSASELYGQGPYAYASIYPPFWSFYLDVVGHIASWFVPGPQWLTTSSQTRALWSGTFGLASSSTVDPVYMIVEKLSLLPFDVVSGLLLYLLAFRFTRSPDSARLAFAFWFLNPLVILVSAVHGTLDVIPTACVLAAFLLLFERRFTVCGMAIATGTLFKIYPILFAPLLLAMAWRDASTKSAPRYGGPGRLLIGMAAVPALTFLAPGLLGEFLQYSTIAVRTGQQAYGLFGFWGWFAIPGPSVVGAALSGSSYAFVGLLAVALITSVLVSLRLVSVRSISIRDPGWVHAGFFIACAAYLLPVVVQAQYVVWSIPFVLLLGLQDRVFKRAYVLLSALPSVFYVLLLGGPLFLFLPLWYQFHVVSFADCYNSITYWAGPGRAFEPLASVPFSVILTIAIYLAGRTFFGHRGGTPDEPTPSA